MTHYKTALWRWLSLRQLGFCTGLKEKHSVPFEPLTFDLASGNMPCAITKCVHGKTKYQCIPCGGAGICHHGKQKTRCRLCGGGSLCQHGERKSRCAHCNGSELCDHGKRKDKCAECNDFVCNTEGCPKHGHKFSSSWALSYHMKSAHADNPQP